jgi:hypothetical protein
MKPSTLQRQMQLVKFFGSVEYWQICRGVAPGVPLLKVDNKSAIVLIKNPVLSGQNRHIKVKYHLVHESASNGQIAVEFIETDNQLGDVLTKSLGKVKFQAKLTTSQ